MLIIKNRIIALILIVFMLVSFSGCRKTPSDKNDNESQLSSETNEKTSSDFVEDSGQEITSNNETEIKANTESINTNSSTTKKTTGSNKSINNNPQNAKNSQNSNTNPSINNNTSSGKNGTLTMNDITINENEVRQYYKSLICKLYGGNEWISDNNFHLVKDINMMPKNYIEYPYIVDFIDNSLYECKYFRNILMNPADVYQKFGYLFMQYKELIEFHYFFLLNIDYETINAEEFIRNLNAYSLFSFDNTQIEKIKNYLNFVQENQIKIRGYAEPLLPIIYEGDGGVFFIRTKLNIEILNAKTNKNIIYTLDDVQFNSNNAVIYLDTPLGMSFNSDSMYVYYESKTKYIIKGTGISY